LEYPIIVQPEGIKLLLEKMAVDQLYHCIFENRVFLFFIDEEQILHCYEVEDPTAIKEISAKPHDIESILRRYAKLE
jgi:hypothetical protein